MNILELIDFLFNKTIDACTDKDYIHHVRNGISAKIYNARDKVRNGRSNVFYWFYYRFGHGRINTHIMSLEDDAKSYSWVKSTQEQYDYNKKKYGKKNVSKAIEIRLDYKNDKWEVNELQQHVK